MYPYNNIRESEVRDRVRGVEAIYAVNAVLNPHRSRSDLSSRVGPSEGEDAVDQVKAEPEPFLLEALTFSLSFLRDKFNIDYRSKMFVDCMGQGCAAALYAFTFDFNFLYSIEMDEESAALGRRRARRVPGAVPKMSIKSGSLQGSFPIDYDVYFLDCSIMRNSMLDEAPLIDLFFRLCKLAISGSFVVLITQTPLLGDVAGDFGVDYLKPLFFLPMRVGSEEESCLWIFKVDNHEMRRAALAK